MTDYKAEAGRIAFALAGHTVRARQVESDIAAALEAAEKRALMDLAEHFDGCGMTLAAAMTRVRAEEVEVMPGIDDYQRQVEEFEAELDKERARAEVAEALLNERTMALYSLIIAEDAPFESWTSERLRATAAKVKEEIESRENAAEKRGRVAGLREAASKAHNFTVDLENDVARAEEVERS